MAMKHMTCENDWSSTPSTPPTTKTTYLDSTQIPHTYVGR